jgi:hypothetical protein
MNQPYGNPHLRWVVPYGTAQKPSGMRQVLSVLLMTAALAYAPAWSAPEIQQGLDAVEKDLAILKETVALRQEVVRQEALGQAQALNARVDELGKRSDTINLWLTAFGILITVLVVGAGFITYVTGMQRARQTAEAWLNEHAAKLKREIEALQQALCALVSDRLTP